MRAGPLLPVGVSLVRRTAPGLITALVVAVVTVLLVGLATGCGHRGTASLSASGAAVPEAQPVVDLSPGLQPLWPFADAAAARAWQDSYRSGGHQPWHLDPEATALSFAQGYLGFTAIDEITSSAETSGGALIGVGTARPDDQIMTAALVHMVRLGIGDDAPWEVVGTRDTTLSVDTPGYGSTVGSPLTVGGRAGGADENLRVQVRRVGAAAPVGTTCCVPAGRENARWSTTVTFTAPAETVLTVVVSTGGPGGDVERFAVTGVRAA
ncbi:hypothetical protein [Pseudonocardia sp. H11422]|uniref:hypothetical protein n=1 Tax=Pseudonocardia sp. H11422 TaxID=2835866 RepID=UPI001BDBE6C8|nr:hypothetical protein [Pseudonocardia sp. H11422]